MKVIHLKHVGALHNCLTDQKLPPDGGNAVHVSLVLHLSDLQTLKTSQCLPATCWHRKGLTVNLSCEEFETEPLFLLCQLKDCQWPEEYGVSRISLKKNMTIQRSQKISATILLLLIIFKYLTACFKLVHPYKMVSLSLLTITEMRTILLKY